MNQAVRNKAFEALEGIHTKNRIKQLEYDNAELVKANEELLERCKKLASKPPEWPKGYRPTRKRYNASKTHSQWLLDMLANVASK